MKPINVIKIKQVDHTNLNHKRNHVKEVLDLALTYFPTRCGICSPVSGMEDNKIDILKCNMCSGLGFRKTQTRLFLNRCGPMIKIILSNILSNYEDSDNKKTQPSIEDIMEQSVLNRMINKRCGMCAKGMPLVKSMHTDDYKRYKLCRAYKIRQILNGQD